VTTTTPPTEVQEPTAAVRACLARGAAAEAIALAGAALPGLPPAARGPVLAAQALAYTSNGQVIEALRAANAARDLAREHRDVRLEIEAVLAAARTLQVAEDHAAAVAQIEAAEALIDTLGDRTLHAQALRRLGVSCSILGQHERALGYLQQACEILDTQDDPAERLGARNSLLNARARRLETLAADDPQRVAGNLELLPQWRQLADAERAHGLVQLEAMARGNHAICAWQCGRLEEALDELQQLLPRYRDFGMRPNVAITYNHLGHIYLRLARHAEARAAYQSAIEMDAGGSMRELRDAWLGLADALEALQDDRGALAALKKTRALEQQLNDAQARRGIEQRELRLEIARLNDHWARLAREDALTGLPNRRALDPWLAEALGAPPQRHPLSLLILDVDHFKAINDTFGHVVGDAVLRTLAELIRAGCRFDDLPARLGGEEFLVAFPNTPVVQATEAALRLRAAIAAYAWTRIAAGLAVTVSVGVSGSEEFAGGVDADTLLRAADRNLYAAKRAGRNRVVSGFAPQLPPRDARPTLDEAPTR
jgi:diguanylate cyclase (GGDEF)-like protein